MENNRLSHWFDGRKIKLAFFIGFCGGLAGVLVDLDHFWGGRYAHSPLLFLAGVIIIYCSARLAGLFLRLVLKR